MTSPLEATSNGCVLLGLLYMMETFAVIYVRLITNRIGVGAHDISRPKSDIREDAKKTGGTLFYFLVMPLILFSEKVHGSSYAAGGRDQEKDVALLTRAQRAQQNCAEYLPIFLILLLVRELQLTFDIDATSSDKNMLKVLVWVYFAGRLLHFVGIFLYEGMSPLRFLGIGLNGIVIVYLAILCTGGVSFDFD